MSTMTLLPCPFCGGEPEIVRAQDEDGRFAAVGCPHCGAGSRQHYFVGDDAVPHVVSAWNRRAHLAQPAQAVDVRVIRAVADELLDMVDHDNMLNSTRKLASMLAAKLTRALSGEKAGPVGDGWKWVPAKATDQMIQAFSDVAWVNHQEEICGFRDAYEAMLSAVQCPKCGQADRGQYGEYPCIDCGLPMEWGDALPASPTPGKEGA